MIKWLAILGLAGCDFGAAPDDDFWTDTRDDDGTDALAATELALGAHVAIDPGTTDDAELVDTVPVGRSEAGASRRVVLRVGAGRLPGLARGDRLIAPVEVQATTRCDVGQTAPGCGYNPTIRVQLLLTGNPDDTSGAGGSRVIATQTQTCTKADHHCMFAFTPGEASLVLDGDLPACVASDSCSVNVVMWAWSSDARPGGADKVLVGGNDGNYLDNGVVEGDVARAMVVRERAITAADRAKRESAGSGSQSINTRADPEVVYSHRLKAGPLVAGEQFLIEAKLVAAVSDRARVSAQLVVSRDPNGTGNTIDKIAPDSISEHNGINCTAGTTPCTSRKVAVLRVTGDVADPVYVNLVVRSEVPGPGSANVSARRGDGWIRSVRYGAALGR
jgi:hypothetical protein